MVRIMACVFAGHVGSLLHDQDSAFQVRKIACEYRKEDAWKLLDIVEILENYIAGLEYKTFTVRRDSNLILYFILGFM